MRLATLLVLCGCSAAGSGDELAIDCATTEATSDVAIDAAVEDALVDTADTATCSVTSAVATPARCKL